MIVDIAAIGAIFFLIGFILGKKTGRKHGYREGTASAALMLREQSLDHGRCCLCQSPITLENRVHVRE